VSGQPSTDDLSAVCTGRHKNIGGATVADYSPHHEPFQHYGSTANPQHLPPTSIAMIGQQDQANHQYDLKDFFAAADAGNLPAVSYLKAAEYQDGHAGYSDPLDEQTFTTQTINQLGQLPSWSSTAVIVLYDDSDGWYDHQMGPLLYESHTPLDALTGPGTCGTDPTQVPSGQEARCGVGPRQPLLVTSPYAKHNFVDGTFTDQSSVVRFIEDNWLRGTRLGRGAADDTAGTLDNLFDFANGDNQALFLDPQPRANPRGDNQLVKLARCVVSDTEKSLADRLAALERVEANREAAEAHKNALPPIPDLEPSALGREVSKRQSERLRDRLVAAQEVAERREQARVRLQPRLDKAEAAVHAVDVLLAHEQVRHERELRRLAGERHKANVTVGDLPREIERAGTIPEREDPAEIERELAEATAAYRHMSRNLTMTSAVWNRLFRAQERAARMPAKRRARSRALGIAPVSKHGEN
jgi:hypothetical protein